VLAARPLKLPVIVSERVAPEAHRITRPWRYLRKYTYRRAALVVAQTRRTAEWFRREIPGATVEVIANPVHVQSEQLSDTVAQEALEACCGDKVVLAAGRLTRQKGFDLLLHAFAALAPRLPAWRLVIFGEGQEGPALRDLSQRLRISDRVVFAGFSGTLHSVMRRSDLFVLSSRFEGMPNALAEAMACGLPCVSFNCPTGPAELIVHGRNGLLAPAEDVTGLTQSMEQLMRDQGLRLRLGSAAEESIRAYSTDLILDRWNAVLTRIAQATDINARSILGD
jgi:GalNAc-alpha-(1->4)-GalNAc-alpha-(1->3)-diNAcBac-PP-undecaprenol alpha-1,4-N-acetyl-D-galactosaminyltransferase